METTKQKTPRYLWIGKQISCKNKVYLWSNTKKKNNEKLKRCESKNSDWNINFSSFILCLFFYIFGFLISTHTHTHIHVKEEREIFCAKELHDIFQITIHVSFFSIFFFVSYKLNVRKYFFAFLWTAGQIYILFTTFSYRDIIIAT